MKGSSLVGRAAWAVFITLVVVFYATPLLWVLLTPFNLNASPSIGVPLPPTLANFRLVFAEPYAARSLFWNSPLIATGVTLVVLVSGALAAYALTRGAIPGRGLILYGLILISAVVSGPVAMIPLYVIAADLNLLGSTLGVILILSALLLPPATFPLRDFLTGVPRSCEEAALLAGASPLGVLRDVVAPLIRHGLMVVGVWVFVSAWGEFFVPFILLRAAALYPASIILYSYRDQEGKLWATRISAFGLLYALPVVILYLFVSRRYGFRFFGGYRG